ncbi:hypothetical protein NYQ10_22145 [Flavobacterium johnsoniae]|uniref:hypothetical protein n=1 Tax=Flavobacterium johnsoniae TaxID=986 RepID=UPI0025B0A297|nr:hypothetical protein [Flavobacterium johnsoniae]WJS94783.1 hypothetical protein NYQ10_22145 [Flavobacterium johnsoniae]
MVCLESKFKVFPIILVAYLSAFPLLAFYLYFVSPSVSAIFPVLLLTLIVIFWFKALRIRANSIKITQNSIMTRRYFGLGKSIEYKSIALDGFVNVFESGRGITYESIFILEKGKRIGCISSFYHKNFDALKLRLKENVIDLGERK